MSKTKQIISSHNNIEIPICVECGNKPILDPVRAELVCTHCGLVLSQKGINYDSAGKCTYSENDKREKLTRGDFHDYLRIPQYKTVVIWKTDMQTPSLKRAFKLDYRANNSAARRELTVGILVNKACSMLDVPTHIKRSCLYYLKKVFNIMDCRGRALADLIGCLLFQICKEQKFSIKIEEVAEACDASPGRMNKWQQIIQSIIPEFKCATISSPVMYIPKLCAKLNLDQNMQTQAIQILKKVPSNLLSGRRPSIIAAALLYLLNNGAVTQKEAAKAINCTDTSIRNIAKVIKPILNKYDPFCRCKSTGIKKNKKRNKTRYKN